MAFERNHTQLQRQEDEVAYELRTARNEIERLEGEIVWNWVEYGAAITLEVGAAVTGGITCVGTLGAACGAAAATVIGSAAVAAGAGHKLNKTRTELAYLQLKEEWFEDAEGILAEARLGFDAGSTSAERAYRAARDEYDSYLHQCVGGL